MRALQAESDSCGECFFPRPTREHVEYCERILVDPSEVSCGLDRNPKGMAVMSESAYHCHMFDLYCSDPRYYRVLESPEEKDFWLRKIDEEERRLRPAWLPPPRRRLP